MKFIIFSRIWLDKMKENLYSKGVDYKQMMFFYSKILKVPFVFIFKFEKLKFLHDLPIEHWLQCEMIPLWNIPKIPKSDIQKKRNKGIYFRHQIPKIHLHSNPLHRRNIHDENGRKKQYRWTIESRGEKGGTRVQCTHSWDIIWIWWKNDNNTL